MWDIAAPLRGGRVAMRACEQRDGLLIVRNGCSCLQAEWNGSAAMLEREAGMQQRRVPEAMQGDAAMRFGDGSVL